MSSNKKVKVATHMADLIKPRKKYFYPCYCVRCKGTEVDSRTQERHTKDKRLWKSKDSRKNQSNAIAARKQKKYSIPSDVPSIKKRKRDSSSHLDRNSYHGTSLNLNLEKSKSSSRFHDPAPDLIEDENNDNDDYYPDYPDEDNNSNDDEYYADDDNNSDDDDHYEEENEDDTNWEGFFASPQIDNDDDEIFIMEGLNDCIDTEIIIWLFKFQQRF